MRRDIPDNYPKFVVSIDTAFGDDIDGIRRLNLADFLLEGPCAGAGEDLPLSPE